MGRPIAPSPMNPILMPGTPSCIGTLLRLRCRAMAEPLLFVTQVAPYRDGPAGVHGVLDQAAVGVAPGRRDARPARPARRRRPRRLARRAPRRRARSRCSRSARRRGARSSSTGDRRPACAPVRSRSARSTRPPTRATAGTSTARSSARASTAIRGRRRSSPTSLDTVAPGVRASRRRLALARRGVPVPRPAARRPGAAARARR